MAGSKRNDGKQLESVISYIEGLRLPTGWKVTPRKLMPSAAGGTAAELDIVISGRAGTMDFTWLIECRDRRKSSAPANWIEQLVTRRSRFNLSKVTAVSTSGFSPEAIELARQNGIDLREFKSLTADEFSCWPDLSFMPHRTERVRLRTAQLGFNTFGTPAMEEAVRERVAELNGLSVLVSETTGDIFTLTSIFNKIIDSNPQILADIELNGPPLLVKFNADMQRGNDTYLLDTSLGPIAVALITFEGTVQRSESLQPLAVAGEYLHTLDRTTIGRVRAFAPHSLPGFKIQTEIHENSSGDELTIVLRAL